MRKARRSAYCLVFAIGSGCGGRVDGPAPEPSAQPPESADAWPASPAPGGADSSVVRPPIDIGGNEYSMNILLNVSQLTLRLRLLFTSYVLDPSGSQAQVKGELRFESET